jgi:hypothetical protein
MNDFTASNGLRLIQRDGGSTYELLSSDGDNMFEGAEWLGSQDMDALREFFQAEADERLGRWRWPDNRDIYVTAEHVGFVTVVDERDPANPGTWERYWRDAKTEKGRAGVAYFDAHPEPKPAWHEAIRGEVWEIAKVDQEAALYVVENTEQRFIHVERRLLALNIDDLGIVSGRRIWPEVS